MAYVFIKENINTTFCKQINDFSFNCFIEVAEHMQVSLERKVLLSLYLVYKNYIHQIFVDLHNHDINILICSRKILHSSGIFSHNQN